MQFLLAAISLGFLGSFHCVGMCGPIALAIPIYNQNKLYKTASVLIYNAGRILTYSTLGIFFGLVGQGFALAGLQQALSVTLGVLILLSVLLPQHTISKYTFTNKLFSLFNLVKSSLAKQLQKKGFISLLFLGILNGLLPCGLVYMAITAAIASSSVLHSVLFMAFFGLATVPLMFSISYFSSLISIQFRSTIRKAIPYVTSIMAILLILRGLNLNVPYLSPKMNTNTNSFISCHTINSYPHTGKLCIGQNSAPKK